MHCRSFFSPYYRFRRLQSWTRTYYKCGNDGLKWKLAESVRYSAIVILLRQMKLSFSEGTAWPLNHPPPPPSFHLQFTDWLTDWHCLGEGGGEVLGSEGGATTPPRRGLIGWQTMSDGEGWAAGDEGWGWGGGDFMSSSAAVERFFSELRNFCWWR